METIESILNMVLLHLKEKTSETVFNLWFRNMKLASLEDSAVFSVDNDFLRDILEQKYTEIVEETTASVVGFRLPVMFISTNPVVKVPQKKKEETIEMEEEFSSASITNRYTFDNFIEGESNKFARAASLAVAKNPFNTYNPLFIWGPSGLGKTHLLYAITNEIKRSHPGVRIVYKKGEDFTNELIRSIQNGDTANFRQQYRGCDVLLIDDIQFIAGKESTQEEFFYTFNALHESEKQIILTSDRPPKDINHLEDRLRTRFEWGLIADMQYPTFELRCAIIRKKAETVPLDFTTEVVEYLASSLKDNVRQIEGVIKKISAYCMISSIPLTVSVCELIVKDFTTGTLSPLMIVDRVFIEVSRKTGVTVEDIKGKKRQSDIAHARHLCCYLISRLTDYSLSSIGDIFNHDHSTAHNSLKKIKEKMEKDSDLKETVDKLISTIMG